MTIVITGSNGFSALHLATWIKENISRTSIIGIDLADENRNRHVDRYFRLEDFELFRQVVDALAEEWKFFHLAGALGNHPLSRLIEANVLWTSKFLETVSKRRYLRSFVNIGSSAEYGRQSAQLLTEELAPNPVTAYGISKHLQTQLALMYAKVFEIPLVCTRTFNLIGPGLSESLVIGKMMREFKEVQRGAKKTVILGRTDSQRDFIDVRDAVKVYWLLSESEVAGDILNVATGVSHSIKDVYQICADVFQVSPDIERQAVATESQDLDYQYADISKLRTHVTLEPFRAMEDSVADMFDAIAARKTS